LSSLFYSITLLFRLFFYIVVPCEEYCWDEKMMFRTVHFDGWIPHEHSCYFEWIYKVGVYAILLNEVLCRKSMACITNKMPMNAF
jgi:hypothetical protein